MARSYVRVSGPLFDGEAGAAVTAWLDDTRKTLAQQGEDLIKAVPMDKTGRATGAHLATISVQDKGQASVVEGSSHRGVTWWPWLEGTSHRNSTTHWRGYQAFKKTRLKLRRLTQPTAQSKLDEYIGRMGGR